MFPGLRSRSRGHLEKQIFLANLNVMLFTPCLIFTKLASRLTTDKLSELAIIPVIFIIQTFVSWAISVIVGRLFGFSGRFANFITAVGVFGNSNSLPISLVLSLSQTIKELHWDKFPEDNIEAVGARGILYLLLFQQLGQLVRWSRGYHVLLAPKEEDSDYQQDITEEGQFLHEEGDEHETQTLIAPTLKALIPEENIKMNFLRDSRSSSADIYYFPRIRPIKNQESNKVLATVKAKFGLWKSITLEALEHRYESLPYPIQYSLSLLKRAGGKCNNLIWEFMNPSLWAMLIAILTGSIRSLQRFFFEDGSLVQNSITTAIRSSGNVAVPLILVDLGANLARITMPTDETQDPEEKRYGNKLLIASLVSRMLLPPIVMAPILALMAKYLPISILNDPIFLAVCFLLAGAPCAVQLAQICQINSIFVTTIGRVLFQSYVMWIFPSTLVLVILALEVVEWSK
ncbi:putative transporter [Fusarium oxysporum f. sp. rapae]|uniref:Putative transporter n=1 Tax=Fusarium oxysporum f. sp. rapae TaxID=485398 RepID=A0A8J5TW19_FUSOX|nr:putative transporter [Fusarium oxysporum f. sp. rapae]